MGDLSLSDKQTLLTLTASWTTPDVFLSLPGTTEEDTPTVSQTLRTFMDLRDLRMSWLGELFGWLEPLVTTLTWTGLGSLLMKEKPGLTHGTLRMSELSY